MTIDLMPFVSRERARSYLCAPFIVDEFTCATNGHIAVWVPGKHAESDAPQIEKSMREIILEGMGASYQPFERVDLPAVTLPYCETCAGRCYIIECHVCKGSGEHECDNGGCGCSHECGACRGRGAYPSYSKDNGAEMCEACSGTGRKADGRAVHLGDELSLAWRYLDMVQKLPGQIQFGVRIAPPDRWSIHRTNYKWVAFRGDGWHAVIMPRRYATGHDIDVFRWHLPVAEVTA